MSITVHWKHILLQYIYAYQKVILQLNSDGFLTKKSTSVYGVCVAGRRQQASKSYENFTDIIMHNTLIISQQHQQILPLSSSWIVLDPQVDCSQHLEKGLKSGAPGEPRMSQGMQQFRSVLLHEQLWFLQEQEMWQTAIPGSRQCSSG